MLSFKLGRLVLQQCGISPQHAFARLRFSTNPKHLDNMISSKRSYFTNRNKVVLNSLVGNRIDQIAPMTTEVSDRILKKRRTRERPSTGNTKNPMSNDSILENELGITKAKLTDSFRVSDDAYNHFTAESTQRIPVRSVYISFKARFELYSSNSPI